MPTPARRAQHTERQGAAWGARPHAWARLEAAQTPVYEEAAQQSGIGRQTAVLDVGCGAGTFLRVAADRGARVSGLDASRALLDLARLAVPEAHLRVGDLEALPYPDDTFDVVTGFNAFQFAGDLTAALREARRVARPGGTVVLQVWGRPERCDLTVMKHVLARLRGQPRPTGVPASTAAKLPPLGHPGVLEGKAAEAGLVPRQAFDVVCGLDIGDDEALVDQMLSAGAIVLAAGDAGDAKAREVILEALAPFRTPGGGYHLENEWRCLLAGA
jgi:SAM-dependent methyltransferase